MTPPPTQSMVSPDSGTSQPTETSTSSTFLRILGDVMGKFVPSDKMSEVFSNLTTKIKEEESRVPPIPIGTLVREQISTQPLSTSTAVQTQTLISEKLRTTKDSEREMEIEVGAQSDEEGHRQKKGEADGRKKKEFRKPILENSEEKELEVMNVEEMETDDDRETMSEGVIRRSTRAQWRMDRGELRSLREEVAFLAAAKREAAERKRKGKRGPK